MRRKQSLKIIRAAAFFEACKGTVVFIAATGLLSLAHRNLYEIASDLVSFNNQREVPAIPSETSFINDDIF